MSAGFAMFLAAALMIAITPGPGILYVAARTMAGGRGEGLASSIGTGLGGLVHVLGAALGVSALMLASAEAFTIAKLAGAAYLVWLGWRMIREARIPMPDGVAPTGAGRALREGIMVEALNPKTAAFFLAFIPQFVDPSQGGAALAAVLLGTISVTLNTLADVVVVLLAARARRRLAAPLIARARRASGLALCCLGAALAFARRPA